MLHRRPFERGVAGVWLEWLARALGETVAPERIAVLMEGLRVRAFSNGEVMTAAKWIESNCRRFPTVADFVQCPDLERNQRPSAD